MTESMNAKQFFTNLDFDPVEIDDLLDNILMDYPDLILDLLRKSSGKSQSSLNDKETLAIANLNSELPGEPNKTYTLQLDSTENINFPQTSFELIAHEETSEDQPNVNGENFEIPTVKVNIELFHVEEATFRFVGSTTTHNDVEELERVPEELVDFETKTTTAGNTNIESSIGSRINAPKVTCEKPEIEGARGNMSKTGNKNVESTKSLLEELEEELERLTSAVNEASLSTLSTRTPDINPTSKRSYASRPNDLCAENLVQRRCASKERPLSAFEHSSLSGGTPGHQLSRYSNNVADDGQEREMARCFNLKGTFSLGRYSQKKNKKQISSSPNVQDTIMTTLGGQKELSRNASEHLFREFKNWQPMHKYSTKGAKDRKRMKHFSSHNLRESSGDSERSSMMMDELNNSLERHLGESIYFNDKIISSWKKKVPSWYKPHMSRHEALDFLRNKSVGSFVVRSSNSYKGAYGLVLKIGDCCRDTRRAEGIDEQVRNYLIECLPVGVRVKGSPSEPIFPDLESLVREHCRSQISLPCKLLPNEPVEINLLEESEIEQEDSPLDLSKDVLDSSETTTRILSCSVLYLSSEPVESLSENAAVRKATNSMYSSNSQKLKKTTICQLRVSGGGLTITDTCRSLFFRRFYPGNVILYAGINTDDQKWAWADEVTQRTNTSRIFGVVTRKNCSVLTENSCHLFAELDHSADEIVSNIMRLVN